MPDEAQPMPKLPPYIYGREAAPNERLWQERDMHAFRADGVKEAMAKMEDRSREIADIINDAAVRYAGGYVMDFRAVASQVVRSLAGKEEA